jgi:hypothetical protein
MIGCNSMFVVGLMTIVGHFTEAEQEHGMDVNVPAERAVGNSCIVA